MDIQIGDFVKNNINNHMFEVLESDMEYINHSPSNYTKITDLETILKFEKQMIVVHSTIDEIKAKYGK